MHFFAQKTLSLTQKTLFLPKDFKKLRKSRHFNIAAKWRRLGLKIIVRNLSFWRRPFVSSYTFCHPATDKNKHTDNNHNSNDVATGFKVYSALLFCPESAQLETLKPYRFLSNLIKIQSLHTIVRSIVSARGQGVYSLHFNRFYHKLEELLGLQYLLVKSPERLNSIWKKDWSQVMNRGKQCQSSKCAGENTEIEGEWLIEYW